MYRLTLDGSRNRAVDAEHPAPPAPVWVNTVAAIVVGPLNVELVDVITSYLIVLPSPITPVASAGPEIKISQLAIKSPLVLFTKSIASDVVDAAPFGSAFDTYNCASATN